MIIGTAAHDDVAALVDMLRATHDWGRFPWAYDPVRMGRFLRDCIERVDALALVLRADGGEPAGVLAADIGELPFAPVRIAQERFWWIDPEHRSSRAAPSMMDAYEAWAIEAGADIVHVSLQAMSDPRLARLFERRGYAYRESHYIRVL